MSIWQRSSRASPTLRAGTQGSRLTTTSQMGVIKYGSACCRSGIPGRGDRMRSLTYVLAVFVWSGCHAADERVSTFESGSIIDVSRIVPEREFGPSRRAELLHDFAQS